MGNRKSVNEERTNVATEDVKPIGELYSILRCFHKRISEEAWSFRVIQWSRVISDLFFAGFYNGLGLFTVQSIDHAGCCIRTEGCVCSLDVHSTRPELVCVGMSDDYKGVALYQLAGGQLSTDDLSTAGGREIFRQQFLSSPADFRFDLVWKLDMSYGCRAVLWCNTSEVFALNSRQLTRLTIQVTTDPPTQKVLTEWNEAVHCTVMKMQCNPEITTFRPGVQPPRTEPKLTDKLAIGTLGGELEIFSTLLDFRSIQCLPDAHLKAIWDIDWNPAYPEILATGSEDWELKLWKVGSDHPIHIIKLPCGVSRHTLHWAPFSSTILAVMSENGVIHVFDLSVNREKPVMVYENEDSKWRAAFAFCAFRPLLLFGYAMGNGFECLEVRPNLLIQNHAAAGSTCSTEQPDLDKKVQELRQILGI